MSDRMAIDLLSAYLKLDLSPYPYDKPLPPLPDEANFDGIRTVLQLIRDYDPALTILELGRLLLQSSDSWLVIGSAQEVADTLAEIYLSGAADGFNLMFPLLPGDFDRFAEQVVPILKAKGVMKAEYAPAPCGKSWAFRWPETTLPEELQPGNTGCLRRLAPVQ